MRFNIFEVEFEFVGSMGSKKNASHTAERADMAINHILVVYGRVPGCSFFQ
jgi:hypothetical protein